jgi:hypothetical protein
MRHVVNLIRTENRLGENMLSPEKKDLTEILKEHNSQAIVNKFLSGEIETLEPTYDPKTGYRYLQVEAIVGDPSQVEAFLNRLVEENVLESKLLDKVIFCPTCGSAGISFRYCCPFCKSFDIQKSSLIEHVKCGYMDLEENFRKGNNLVCPKCHEQLGKIDVDYRKAGVWCACRQCKKSFDVPVPVHFCKSCQTVSNFEQAVIRDVYSYTLSKHVKEKLSSNLFLIVPIQQLFVQEGYRIESPALLQGKSGAKHSFDIAAFNGGHAQRPMVVDLALSTDTAVSEQPVIALFAKIFDVTPDKAFLIAIPKLSENAKKMAELYNIQAVEANSPTEALAKMKEKLSI